MKFKLFFTALLSLMLVACSGCSGIGGTTTETQQIATACASASAALRVLTVANDAGKLDADAQKAVITAIGITNPICAADTPPTMDTVKLQAFTQAIALLQAQALRLGKEN
jgi:hypothetical protein